MRAREDARRPAPRPRDSAVPPAAHRVSVDEASGAFFVIGVELGYNWLLGHERNFSVGVGASGTRLFGGSLDGVSLTLPAVRLVNIGWSF